MTAAEWVDLIIRRGDELRAVGALRISADGCSAVLAVNLPEIPQGTAEQPPPHTDLDPLEDPMTFGGGRVPGIAIPERIDDDGDA